MVNATIVNEAGIRTRLAKVIANIVLKDSTPLHQDKPLAQNVRQDLSTHMMRVQNTPNANAVPPAPTQTYNDKNSALTAQKDSTRRAVGKALAQSAPQDSSMRQLPTAASTTAAQDSLPPPTAHACSAQSAGLQGISHAPNAKGQVHKCKRTKFLLILWTRPLCCKPRTITVRGLCAWLFHACACAEECKSCPIGWFSNNEINTGTSCKMCTRGMFASIAASINCEGCPPGKLSATGDGAAADVFISCTECRQGRFVDVENFPGTTCKLCAIGRFAETKGQSSCAECPAGKITSSSGESECAKCPPDHSTTCVDIQVQHASFAPRDSTAASMASHHAKHVAQGCTLAQKD